MPNEDNGLYEAREQFRSSYTVVLLAADHGLKLVEDDPKTTIPDYPSGCRLAYVDRFGNLVLYEHAVREHGLEGEKNVLDVIRKNTGGSLSVRIIALGATPSPSGDPFKMMVG